MDLVDPFDYYDKHGVWPTYRKNNVANMEARATLRNNKSAKSPRFASPRARPASPRAASPRTASPRAPVKSVRTPRGRAAPRSGSAEMRELMRAPLSDMPPPVSPVMRASSPRASSPRASSLRASSLRASSPRASSPRASSPRSPMVRPGRVASPTGRELKPPRGDLENWKNERPKTKAEREAMNPNCFLGKRKDGSPGYPICAKGTDRISCAGVVGAKRRAGMVGDLDVVAKAEELNKRYNCTKKVRMEQERAASNARRR